MAKEQLSKKQEEIAKWLMDLAKYIITGVVLSTIFGGIENKWMMVVFGILIAAIFMYAGVSFLDTKQKTSNKKKK